MNTCLLVFGLKQREEFLFDLNEHAVRIDLHLFERDVMQIVARNLKKLADSSRQAHGPCPARCRCT